MVRRRGELLLLLLLVPARCGDVRGVFVVSATVQSSSSVRYLRDILCGHDYVREERLAIWRC